LTVLRKDILKKVKPQEVKTMENQEMDIQTMENQEMEVQTMEDQEMEIQTMENQEMEFQAMENQEMEILTMTEDEQIAYAIKRSMAETNATGAGCEEPEPKKRRIFKNPNRPLAKTGSQRITKYLEKKKETEVSHYGRS
jgi:hypothetical protein